MDDKALQPSERQTRIIGVRRKLTPEQRHEIIRRHQQGEKNKELAQEFGVSRQAVDQLIQYHLKPETRIRKQNLRSRMLPGERAKLVEILRTTVPRDHALDSVGKGHPDFWNSERVIALGKKLFDKKLYTYAVRDCIQEARPDTRFDPDAKPEPPGPPDVRDLDPEFAEDPEFVNYYLSPISQPIPMRSHGAIAASRPSTTITSPVRLRDQRTVMASAGLDNHIHRG